MIAIRAARLFDGMNLLDGYDTVVIDGERVVEVRAGVPAAAEPIELGDATLLPGLVDTHTHLCFNASDDPVGHLDGLHNETLLDEMRSAARAALGAGVTTLRDLGDRDYLALRIRLRPPPIPWPGPRCWPRGRRSPARADTAGSSVARPTASTRCGRRSGNAPSGASTW